MNQSLFKRPFFWYGIYYGIASILLFTIIYAVNLEFFGRFFMWMLAGVVILLDFMIMGGMAERKANGGYLKYFDAFKYLFFIGVIGYIINLLFTILFVNFIDTDFNNKLAVVIKESSMEWMEKYDMPEDKIEAQVKEMDKQFANANSAWNYIKQFIGGAVMSALFALLCALFVKRNPPEGMVEAEVLDSGTVSENT